MILAGNFLVFAYRLYEVDGRIRRRYVKCSKLKTAERRHWRHLHLFLLLLLLTLSKYLFTGIGSLEWRIKYLPLRKIKKCITCFSPLCFPDVVLCKRSNTFILLGRSSSCWIGSSDGVIELKQKDQQEVSCMNTAMSILKAIRYYRGPYERKIVVIFCIGG